MFTKNTGLFLGICFIILGLFLILENYYFRYLEVEYLFAAISAVLAFLFYSKYFGKGKKWYGLVLGSVFLFLTITFYVEANYIHEEIIGISALIIIGCSFLTVFLRNTDHWWAIIPAGVMLTNGVAALADYYHWMHYGDDQGVVFLLGFSITFGVLYLLKNENRKLGWAIYPAIVFLVLSAIVGLANSYYLVDEFFLPAILIFFGSLLIYKSLVYKKKNNDNQIELS
jgi:hypothetical protein